MWQHAANWAPYQFVINRERTREMQCFLVLKSGVWFWHIIMSARHISPLENEREKCNFFGYWKVGSDFDTLLCLPSHISPLREIPLWIVSKWITNPPKPFEPKATQKAWTHELHRYFWRNFTHYQKESVHFRVSISCRWSQPPIPIIALGPELPTAHDPHPSPPLCPPPPSCAQPALYFCLSVSVSVTSRRVSLVTIMSVVTKWNAGPEHGPTLSETAQSVDYRFDGLCGLLNWKLVYVARDFCLVCVKQELSLIIPLDNVRNRIYFCSTESEEVLNRLFCAFK